MRSILASAAVAAVLAVPVQADEVADTIRSALTAYEEGDLQYALEELAAATQMINALRTDALSGYLPAAPEGWTREVNADFGRGLALFGGGTGAEARYDGPGGESFTLSILADSPVVASFAAIFGNPAMMSQMGTVTRIGRHRVLDQNGQLVSLLGSRILVQASGAAPEVMLPFVRAMDLDGLASFNP